MEINLDNIDNVFIGGIDHKDYPDFVDAYIESADYYDEGIGKWRSMTDEELDYVTDNYSDFVLQKTWEQIF